ncbi:MAG TPA: hypothetical protein VKW04_16500 [Planctomycetota bacterium]|nr:hypothetical protein [Planctomycetota bacterium]
MTRLAILTATALVLQLVPGDARQSRVEGEGVKPRYGADKGGRDRVFVETKLGITIDGTDQLANMVRSMHPFLSMEKLMIRAEGGFQVVSKNRRKLDYDEARVEVRYDDNDHEYEFQKGQAPEDDKDKLRQMMFFLAAAGRNYTLSPEGEYRSDDPNQDQNGEAMDLMLLGITRMPDGPVKEGDTYEKKWKGQRTEKNKPGRYDFVQKVTVERIEEKDGKKVATLAGELSGKVDSGKDPAADEGWTKCAGKTKTVLEVDTGRVLASEGRGDVTVYFRNTADTGSKQEVKLTFKVEGKLAVK